MTDQCWIWTGGLGSGGYGSVGIGGRKTALVHRLVYEELVGRIPDGLVLDHLCRNRACYNPRHLEPVTLRENILRGEGHAAKHARKTHCVNGHPFDAANTYRQGSRRCCRACGRAATARYLARKKQL